MSYVNVQRVFGRTSSESVLEQFTEWFNNNIDKLEVTLDEVKQINGTMTVDWQEISRSYIVEVKTIMQDFATEIKAKFVSLEFDDSAIIGDIKAV